MLARLTGSAVWTAAAQHALAFVKALYNIAGGFFWTGTGDDGVSFNTDPKSNIPEDVQTWSYLAMLDKNFAVSLDWAKTNLSVTDTPQAYNSVLTGNVRFRGVSYATFPMRPDLVETGRSQLLRNLAIRSILSQSRSECGLAGRDRAPCRGSPAA